MLYIWQKLVDTNFKIMYKMNKIIVKQTEPLFCILCIYWVEGVAIGLRLWWAGECKNWHTSYGDLA